MLKLPIIKKYCLIIPVLIVVLLSSCATQKTVYFTDVPDSVIALSVSQAEFKEPIILTDDILSITIQTIDPNASAVLNQATPAGSPSAATGFLVDKKGSVEIPMLGEIMLAGLTTNEAKERIKLEVSKYYKDPTVQVRFANYKITMIGEVSRPATYTVPNEKFTILDAVGMAGDLTIYGKRENVMLIRDNMGKKEIVRLDLTSTKLLQSPYYYLKQNDVIYVEPSKARIAANNAASRQNITLGITLFSLVLTILTRL